MVFTLTHGPTPGHSQLGNHFGTPAPIAKGMQSWYDRVGRAPSSNEQPIPCRRVTCRVPSYGRRITESPKLSQSVALTLCLAGITVSSTQCVCVRCLAHIIRPSPRSKSCAKLKLKRTQVPRNPVQSSVVGQAGGPCPGQSAEGVHHPALKWNRSGGTRPNCERS